MKIMSSKELGTMVRERRKELGYTQAFVSDFTGLSVSFISDVENGKPTIEFEKTLQLIQILGMDFLVDRR